MNAIKALIRNGRVETDVPVDLPEGTEVLIVRPDAAPDADDHWADTPEANAAWQAWYDSLQPLVFTPAERDALEADRAARKAWELAHADERAEKLRRLWE